MGSALRFPLLLLLGLAGPAATLAGYIEVGRGPRGGRWGRASGRWERAGRPLGARRPPPFASGRLRRRVRPRCRRAPPPHPGGTAHCLAAAEGGGEAAGGGWETGLVGLFRHFRVFFCFSPAPSCVIVRGQPAAGLRG